MMKHAQLKEMLASNDTRMALFAAETLRRRDDYAGLPRALELFKKAGAHRARAATVLGGFREERAVAPLIEALGDPDRAVRTAAYTSLGRVLRSLFPFKRLDLATTGYTPDAPAAQRTRSARVISAWWRQNRPQRG